MAIKRNSLESDATWNFEFHQNKNLPRHRYAEKQSAQLEQIQKEFIRCSRGFPVNTVVPPEDEVSTIDPSRERRRQATRQVLQQLRDTRRNK